MRPADRTPANSRWIVQILFRFFWLLLVLWFELAIYHLSLVSCRWPKFGSTTEQPSHVLLLSDTQLLTAPYVKSLGRLPAWQRFLADLNLRKNWRVASHLNPHAVIFLGDMLASGRNFKSLKEYDQGVQYLKSIFVLPHTPTYFIPGNTDVSLGVGKKHSKDIKAFFSHSFGPLNQAFSIQNHTFVGLDAPGLVDEDYQRAAQGIEYDDWNGPPDAPVSFVRSVDAGQQPLILLSHIPLSRPTTATCGPLREKGTINRNVGHGYQSMLGKQTTQFLLKTLRPALVFSGDNRDYCEYTHSFTTLENGNPKLNTAREVTVKSFSMSRHIRRPGFQLLSVVNPSSLEGKSFADIPCLLPDQGRIYSTFYPISLALTLLALFIMNKTGIGRLKKGQLPALQILARDDQPHHDGNPWTPRTARTPLGPVHSTARKLNGHLRSFSVSSCPTTPHGSPPRHYVMQSGESDEEEAMYPAYSSHHLHHDHELQNHQEEWTSKSEKLSLPGWKPVEWGWTFVFRGRRRRMTLPALNWKSIVNFYELCTDLIYHRRQSRNVATSLVLDMISVLWPASLLWLLITWIHF